MKKARTSGDEDDDQLVVRREGTMVGSGPKILGRCSSGGRGVQQQLEEDRISSLPDHILVFILSLMGGRGEVEGEIEQVVRTSVLARRWRYLWRDSLKSLSFSFDQRMSFHEDYEDYKATRSAFVNRVNLILHFHPDDTIDDFTLNFWSDFEEEEDNFFDYASSKTVDAYMEEVDNWFGFALSKRVKRLSFNFTLYPHCFALTRNLIQDRNMDSLVSLCLDRVDVKGEVLEYLLTVCGSLEHLSISESTTLVDFTVSGLRLKLKHLKIHYCWKLRRLCIRDVKLVSFDFDGMSADITIFFENTPHLVNGRLLYMDITAKILSYLPQLQALVLEFPSIVRGMRPTMEFPKLMNLVRLELVLGKTDFSCAICASLLVSSPSIRELKLLFQNLNEDCYEAEVERLKRPHECLAVVELVGFVGCQLDTGVALYLIENTLSLERIIVDTSHPMISLAKETRETARAKAKEQLGPRLLNTRTRFSLT